MPASTRYSVKETLEEAAVRSGKYEWMIAAELYRRILDGLDLEHDPLEAARVAEFLAECYFKAAFQSGSRDEFRRTMGLSHEYRGKVAALYEEAGGEALAKRAMSRELFASFWLQNEPDEKRATMEKCISLAQEAVHTFEVRGDKDQLVETLLDLIVYRENALHLSIERKQLVDLFESTVESANRLIEEFGGLTEDHLVLESINLLVRLYVWAEYVVEQPRYDELERKLEKLREKIGRLREKIATPRAVALAYEASGLLAADLEGDTPKALELFQKSESEARNIGDRYMVGRLNTSASANMRYLALGEEYVEKRRERLERALELASSAIQNLLPSSPGAWLKYAYGRYVEHSTYLALAVETDIENKRTLLRKAISVGRKGMSHEKFSFVLGSGHELSKALYFLSTMDVGPEEKLHLLSEALEIRNEIVKPIELLCPHSWNRGVYLNYLALLKAELSKTEKDEATKLGLLREASSDMEQCVKLVSTLAGIGTPVPGKIRALALYYEWHGDILQQLYNTTLDMSTARQAITAYEETVSYLSKIRGLGQIPAIRWKIARTYDSLREYKEASQSFHRAAEEYRLAGTRLPGLAPAFEEFAQYMEAWALIAESRLSHDQELYTPAAESYTKAANLLRATRAFGHLSKHYSACSFLELGEALSRQDRQHSAIESFKAAQATFQEARDDLDSKLRNVSPSEDKKELKDWVDITQGRLKYSLGRAQLEDAKVLDARGEEEASSAQYRTASETFGSLLSETDHEQTRRDLEALGLLCDAWAKMKAAEAKASPELYAEAAESFTKVEKTAFGKRSQLTALANASMCKALESGSLFRRTRDKQLYAEIKSRLETAADFYEEAGIKKTADWSRATQRFFDALTFLGQAEVETDPRKKTEFYHLAEKHLHLAAELFGEAGYFKKKEEALSHLRRVQSEKELLLTPIEALDQNPALTAATVTPVSLTLDQASGLERFEAADVVGSAGLDQKVVSVDSDLVLELEIANVGKTAATLLKIENIAQEGFELVRDRTDQRIEDGYIDMRGRRLEYLKTHKVKVPIRAKRKGAYELRPRVLYVDEKGASRSYEFEASPVIVTEVAGRSLLESERRLSAIMFTDLVGYTFLTEENEVLALELLEEHRKLLRPLFPKHSGKEVKTVGDMFLVEFASALDAVRCAIQIQDVLSKRNLDCSEPKKIRLRVGIHIGDVEHSHGDVYGDAVNIASRIEPLAEPGGIVVTRQVYEQIRNRPGIKTQSLGVRKLKNVKESLEVFSVSS